ncbi:MAG: hypothetical protein M1816_001873 [Peltula sp. TS41687]|nr:MAG: hypothetical protein M1816_001873 [Peltula sp. TS41687]
MNKIIRTDYSERFYMDLAYEAMEQWKTLPELKKYFHQTGWIDFSGNGSELASIRENFRARGRDPTKDIPLDELREMFGGIYKHTDFSGVDGAYWNPEAGWCDASAATVEMMQAAVNRGVKYEIGNVARLVLGISGVDGVQLSDGRILTADKVLPCAGARTSSLMSPVEDHLQMDDSDRLEKQVMAACICVAHCLLGENDLVDLKSMPVTIYALDGDAQPPPGNLLKFTNSRSLTNTIVTPSGHRISVPPDRDQTVVSNKLKEETRTVCHKLFPQFTSRPEAYWRLCCDAITPSQDHLITKHPHPQLGNLYIAVGGSFHSYKFLPNIGKYIVNVLGGISNGQEADVRWAWKSGNLTGRGAHEEVYPARELRDLDDDVAVLPISERSTLSSSSTSMDGHVSGKMDKSR